MAAGGNPGAGRGPRGPVILTRGFNCPSCGSALTLRAGEHALTVICDHCNSILDAKDPNLQVLQKFQAKTKVKPMIPLGTRGEIGDATYEAIGFQVRTITVSGINYSWREYLLFNPFKGFRYITEYDGHWNLVRTLRSVPETSGGTPPRMRFRGESFRHFQTAVARSTYVLGEFPWQVRIGEKAVAQDYVAPPRMLSSETTGTAESGERTGEGTGQGSWAETVWSTGTYTPGAQIWKAFKLPGAAPQPTGIFANQPSPYEGRVAGIWKVFAAALLGLLLLAIFFAVSARRERVFNRAYTFVPQGGESSFVTEVFELKGRASTVELSINTNLANNWTYFNFALINDDTGHAYDFGREVSYYYGQDSDGSWTEGSNRDRALIPAVPPGRYYLRVEPEVGAGEVAYTLTIVRDVPPVIFYFLAALLLAIPPIFVTVRSAAFESRRWQESDYGGGSDDDDDDDE